MRGYREVLNARLAGNELNKVFIFVDVMPLIETGNGWLKSLPLGFIVTDPLDEKPMPLHGLYDTKVYINGGCKQRNEFIAECVMAAKPKSLTVNTAGGDIEIWETV